MQDFSNSIANTLELLESCTKPSMWYCLKDNSDKCGEKIFTHKRVYISWATGCLLWDKEKNVHNKCRNKSDVVLTKDNSYLNLMGYGVPIVRLGGEKWPCHKGTRWYY